MPPRLGRLARRDGGAALLITLALTAVIGLMLAASLALIRQAGSAEAYESLHTQALYNARMGVDAALYYLSHDAADLARQQGNSQLQAAVENSLAQLNQPPFQVSLTVDPLTTHHGESAAAVAIASTGIAGSGAQPVRVTLSVGGAVTLVSRGGGGSGNQQEAGSLTVTSSPGPNISVSGGPIGVAVHGSQGNKGKKEKPGSLVKVIISASGTAVTMTDKPAPITKNNTTFKQAIKGNAWIDGSNDTFNNSIQGDAIVQGSNDTFNDKVDGTAVISGGHTTVNNTLNGETIVSGNRTVLNGPVRGPLIVTANDVKVKGKLSCGAVITGNNVSLEASVDGPLILAGTGDQVGSSTNPVVLRGGLVLVGDKASVIGTIDTGAFLSPFSKTAVISLGQNESLTGTVKNNIAEVKGSLDFHPAGKFKGSLTTISPTETVGWKKTCWGQMTLSVAPAPTSSSGLSHVTLNYGSTAVSG